MFRSLIRSGVVALCILALSTPARALPLTSETESFASSLAVLWDGLVSSVVDLWTTGDNDGRGTCDPNGGDGQGSGEGEC